LTSLGASLGRIKHFVHPGLVWSSYALAVTLSRPTTAVFFPDEDTGSDCLSRHQARAQSHPVPLRYHPGLHWVQEAHPAPGLSHHTHPTIGPLSLGVEGRETSILDPAQSSSSLSSTVSQTGQEAAHAQIKGISDSYRALSDSQGKYTGSPRLCQFKQQCEPWGVHTDMTLTGWLSGLTQSASTPKCHGQEDTRRGLLELQI
jgi:hypothetical protein